MISCISATHFFTAAWSGCRCQLKYCVAARTRVVREETKPENV